MFKPANKKSKFLGAVTFWSSSDYGTKCAYYINTLYGGSIYYIAKASYFNSVRTFANVT